MAQATGEGPGRDEIALPDLLADGAPVAIPLDPARSAVENAERGGIVGLQFALDRAGGVVDLILDREAGGIDGVDLAGVEAAALAVADGED